MVNKCNGEAGLKEGREKSRNESLTDNTFNAIKVKVRGCL